MTLETFFEKLELFADTPNAVANMRKLVLRTAAQGKLVRQDLNEEPASELVRRAVQARKQLVAAGLVRDEVPELGFLDQIDSNLPVGWVLAPLSVYVGVIMGQSPPSSAYNESGEGLPFYQGKAQFGQLYPTATNWCTEPTKIGEPGDVVISVRAPVGPTNVLRERSCIGRGLAALRSLGGEPMHLVYTLRAFEQDIAALGVGSTFVAVSKHDLDTFLIPVPPLAEQKRIVAKVDELMALCDRLEAQQQERKAKHTLLARASLARFSDAPTPANLDFLFHDSYSIDPADLRKSILTLAVLGKLVSQDPNDEPAIAAGEEDENLANQSSFEIPQGWAWTRLSNLADINGGFAFKSTDYTDEGMRVVRISDFDEFGFKDHKIVRHLFSPELARFSLAQNNILMAMTGGTVGKSYLVRSLPEPMIVNQRVATIKASARASPHYIDVVIRSEMTQEVIRKAKNSTNDNISMVDIKGFAIPVPPFAEQRRIVAKVEELMTLVDTLETQLATARTTAEKLMEAVVAELTTQD